MNKPRIDGAVDWNTYNTLVKGSKNAPPLSSDMVGNPLSVGDYVVITRQRDSEVYISRVIKVGPKSSLIRSYWRDDSRKTNIYMLKIDPPKDFEIDIS